MRDHFIFYSSFYETIIRSPDVTEQNKILRYLVDCALGVIEISDVPYPIDMAIDQMMISVNRSQSRYEKAVESGKKGGRPSRWVDQAEAERLFAEHKSWAKVAEIMDVSDDTLYRARMKWKNTAKPQNPQNHSVSVSKSVSVSDSVSESESDTRNNKINNRANGLADAYAPTRVSEKKLAERKIRPSKEETIALLRSLQAEREKERRENEDRREGGTG